MAAVHALLSFLHFATAMSTITLQISVSNVFKKVTVAKTLTVNQLIEHIGEKFKIKNLDQYPDAYLVIINNNKKLDKLLPLRLTNLINNSRLKLVLGTKAAASQGRVVSLKIVVNKVDNTNYTTILEEDNTVTVKSLLQKVEERFKIQLLTFDSVAHKVVVNVLETKLVLGVDNIDKSLSSIIGNVSSLVIRIDFSQVKNEQRELEQQKINKLQLDNQRDRERQRQERELQERELQLQQREKELEEREQRLRDEQLETGTQEQKQTPQESHHQVSESSQHQVNESNQMQVEESKHNHAPPVDFNSEVSKDPQLFKPSTHQSYENPDEDYEVTVSQIQKYQKLISNSVKPKTPIVRQKPSSYTVRIKFPNQSILQLYFENGHEVRLGQLLKKVDELLIEKYINNYNLKLGFPPFNKLSLNFSANNKLLNELPEFQSDKITLIWELATSEYNHDGPFLKEDIIKVLQSSQLPEMILESHRGELEDEETVASNHLVTKQLETKKLGSKVPKWFKPK